MCLQPYLHMSPCELQYVLFQHDICIYSSLNVLCMQVIFIWTIHLCKEHRLQTTIPMITSNIFYIHKTHHIDSCMWFSRLLFHLSLCSPHTLLKEKQFIALYYSWLPLLSYLPPLSQSILLISLSAHTVSTS